MKVLIAGADGQLGTELQKSRPAQCDVLALTVHDLDITEKTKVFDIINEFKPNWVINAAAYTAVDQAEQSSQRAENVNANGVGYLATAAKSVAAKMVQVSTDFVFDGLHSRPYPPDFAANPLSVYGKTKLEGEKQAQSLLGEDLLLIRTAWVYALEGQNFVHTMLRLMKEKPALSVVSDQVGTPTWAKDLAEAIWQMMAKNTVGTFHFTNTGVCSWYDFAVAIQEEAVAAGLLGKMIPITPIPSEAYPTPAVRPSYSVLDKEDTWRALGYIAPHWRESLRSMILQIRNRGEC